MTLILPYLYNGNVETNTINTANGGVTAVYHNSDSDNTDKAERNPLRADDYAKSDSLDTNKNPVCTTRVIVSSGISINVYTGGQLIISGQLDGGGGGANYAGQTGGYHARLVLESGAKVNVNGTLYVLGFIDDESATNNPAIVTISSGGTLYEPFIIRDFKGGTITGAIYMGMSSYGYSPFRQFTLMNVNTKLKVDYGAYVIGIANIYASSSHNMDVAPLVGKDATSDTSFIQLKSGAYLISKYDESTQITTLDIYGGAKTNEFSVTVEKLDKTASSKDFIFPISWMYHVTLNNGEYEMCEGNRFRLLPGAEFKVAQGATLRINYLSIYDSFIDTTSTRPYPSKYPSSSSLNGIDLPAAKMTVNGTLYATAVGGRIYTEVDGAVVKVEDLDTSDNISVAVKITNNEPAAYGLANAYVSSRSTFNTTLKLYYIDAIGNILGSTGYTQTNKTFTSYTDGSTHNWKSNPEITSYPEIVEITFTGVDSAGNPYYVRTDEAVRYDANGKPEFYTFEYDHELGGNQKIQVFAGAEIIFTLSHNQVFSATGATSFKYSDLTLASNKDSTTYNVIWEADSSKKDKFRVLATVGLIITNTAYTETFEISYTDSNNDGFYDKASIKIQNTDGGGLFGVSKDATKFSVTVNGVSGTVTSKKGGLLTKYIASYTYSSSEFIHSDSKPIYEIVVSP